MANQDDNGQADTVKRFLDATKLKFGYCTNPYSYEPCPHSPRPSFAPRSRWDHLGNFREGDRRGGPGPYLGQGPNQLPLRYYHRLLSVTAREHLNRYLRERLQQSGVAEALKARTDTYGSYEATQGKTMDIPLEYIPPITEARSTTLAENNQDHLPSKHQSPWLPTDDQWLTFLQVVGHAPLRNQVMILLAYEAALRSRELLGLLVSDIDLVERTVTIRAETTKTRQARVAVYPESIHGIIAAYVTRRYQAGDEHSPLFPSESSLNPKQPILHTAWSKMVKELALQVGIPQFSTHTFRHKRLHEFFSA